MTKLTRTSYFPVAWQILLRSNWVVYPGKIGSVHVAESRAEQEGGAGKTPLWLGSIR